MWIAAIDGTPSPLFQNLDSDFSSGYLEDALLEFTEMSKRRRLLSFHGKDDDDLANSFNDLAMVYTNFFWICLLFFSSINKAIIYANQRKILKYLYLSFFMQNYMNSENFSCMNRLTTIDGVSGDDFIGLIMVLVPLL